jgi:hypothetical protein
LWTLAFNTILPHSQLCLAIACFLFISIIFKLFSALPHHLLHGLPLFLIPSLAAVAVCSSTLLFCIFSTWTYCFFYVFLTVHCSVDCFNYRLNAQFIYSNNVYYIIILDMFRAISCSSSGGQIVLLQHLISSVSVSSYSVRWLRADCNPLSTGMHGRDSFKIIVYSCLHVTNHHHLHTFMVF